MKGKERLRNYSEGSGILVFLGILAFFLLLATPVPVRAESYPQVNISGTVYASNLKDNAEVTLTGNTSIVVNTNKTIRFIHGRNYSLSITKGSGDYTLTLAPKENNFSDGIIISAKTFATNASVKIAPQGSWNTAVLTDGFINLQQGSRFKASNCTWGLYSTGANISMNGDATISVGIGACVSAQSNVNVSIGPLALGNKSNTLNKRGCIESRGGDIRIMSGYTLLDGYRGLYAEKGNILINGGTVTAETTSTAIDSPQGKVELLGKLSAKGEYGIWAGGYLQVYKNGIITLAQGSKHGIYCVGSVYIYGNVNATGLGNDGIHSQKGSINVYNGTVRAAGKKNAFYVESGKIMVQSPLGILVPKGGKISTHNIVNSAGKDATSVAIGPTTSISGSVSIANNKSYQVGDTLTANVSTSLVGTKTITWEYSDKSSGASWATISGAVSSTYKTTDLVQNKYVRASVSIDRYEGTLKSNAVFINPGRAVITQQPVSASTTVGKAFSFTVKATNAKSYRWYIYDSNGSQQNYPWARPYFPNHAIYNGQNTQTITITPTDTWLNGKYIACDIVNSAGTGITVSTYVKMSVTDFILKQPSSASTYIGKPVYFNTSIVSGLVDKCYWYVYDTDDPYDQPYSWRAVSEHAAISGETTENIRLIPFDTWLDGKYIACGFTFKAGFYSYTNSVKISVDQVITTHPASASTKVGTTFSFKAEAKGAVSYNWWVSDIDDDNEQSHAWSTIRSHATVVGEQSYLVRITPTDTWLNNKWIYCSIYLGNSIYVHTKFAKMSVEPDTSGVTPTPGPSPGGASPGTRLQTYDGTSYVVVEDSTGPAVSYLAPGSTAQGTIKIPDSIISTGVSYNVVSIGSGAFKGNKKVTSVVIGKNVKTILKNAFYGCTNLKYVSMGSKVTTIGKTAFYQCTSLQEITIPAKVKTIKSGAFRGCKKLRQIIIKTTKLTEDTVGANAFLNIYGQPTIQIPESKLASYKKLLKARGVSSNAICVAI